MKAEMDDGNYEAMIVKLVKGSSQQKSSTLKKFIFLYENARSRIYLYERRITECLELLLLIEQKDIATLTLSLLQKIIANTMAESDIFIIIKKKLLSKIVLNLGSVGITTRKISHKCILEYVRKCKDYDAVVVSYIKTGIQQTENSHLKLKSINSLHSLIMAEPKFFQHGILNAQVLLEEIIYASHQREFIEVRRASILCLLEILRLDGSEKTLKMICPTAQKDLYDLKMESTELASLLQIIMRYKNSGNEKTPFSESEIESVPSPKFMSINEEEPASRHELSNEAEDDKSEKLIDNQMKIYNDVSYAEEFLKKLEKNEAWELDQIREFAPYLEKYLVDESIKLFSVSKKIVEVIFDNECEEQKDYYTILVPCVVNGIGNKRFIVRKNLDKLVRQYIKNHTEIWVQNFIERFAQTQNQKIKEILIDLFLHAYRTSPEFYHPTGRTFTVMEKEIKDSYSNLKWKAVDCLITVIEKQSKNDKMKEEMMSTLSPEVYNKIIRKMNKTHNSIGSNSGSVEPLSPTQRLKRKERRQIRLTTDEPTVSLEKMNDQETRKNNVSEEKNNSLLGAYRQRDRKIRKSQADIDFKLRRPKEERQSIKKLPQLKRGKYTNIVSSRIETNNESPVKKSMAERSIMYIDKQNLPQIPEPRSELEKALVLIKDSSWNTQFESINCIRSIVENNKELITEEIFNAIVGELLNCLNNMRSGVSKIALICLGELLRRFHKRSHPFTEQIITTLVRKSMTTSDFIQEEIRRCILISVEELCPLKTISTLTSLKDNSKGAEVKLSILSIVDAVAKNDRFYRKDFEWIWNTLIDFHEDPNLQVKTQSRRIAKAVIEAHRDWKSDINGLRPQALEKIDKIIKAILVSGNSNGLNAEASWLETQNKELGKIISSKVMTSKYFASEYSKFEEQDRILNVKKNFKERSRILNSVFASAFEYSSQFQTNPNAKRYIAIAIDHLDDKNPGLFLNSLSVLTKCLQYFPSLIEDCFCMLAEKLLPLVEVKKLEIGPSATRLLARMQQKLDKIKCCRELIKMSGASSSSLKVRAECFNQIYSILKSSEAAEEKGDKFSSLESLLTKSLLKIAADTGNAQGFRDSRLREVISMLGRHFSPEFAERVESNPRLSELLGRNSEPLKVPKEA